MPFTSLQNEIMIPRPLCKQQKIKITVTRTVSQPVTMLGRCWSDCKAFCNDETGILRNNDLTECSGVSSAAESKDSPPTIASGPVDPAPSYVHVYDFRTAQVAFDSEIYRGASSVLMKISKFRRFRRNGRRFVRALRMV